MLICLEASADDAGAHGLDVRRAALPGLRRRPIRARRACARWSSRRRSPRDYGRVAIELSGGTQASDRMVGEPTTFGRGWFDAFPDAERRDAAARGRRARSRPRRRSSACTLANEIAAAAMEHVRGVLQPGMTCAQAAAAWQGYVHGEGTGWQGQGRARAAVLADLVGPVDPHVHRHLGGARAGGRADALRDLGVRRRLLGRPHEEPRLRRAEAALPRARAGPAGGLRRGGRARRGPGGSLADARPPRARGHRRARLPRPALAPDPATASARARTSRRTPTRRSRPRSTRAWCSRSSPAATGPRAAACASRTTSSSPRTGPQKLSPFPDGIVNV